MGNDLIDYVKQEDHLLVLVWPPIAKSSSMLVKSIASSMIPNSWVRLNNKKGRIQVFVKKG